jgi:hypothetical protein
MPKDRGTGRKDAYPQRWRRREKRSTTKTQEESGEQGTRGASLT